jgi:hypothetical protein
MANAKIIEAVTTEYLKLFQFKCLKVNLNYE